MVGFSKPKPSSDFAERAYLFGTTGFELDLTDAIFTVNPDGSRNVSGMRVKANTDIALFIIRLAVICFMTLME